MLTARHVAGCALWDRGVRTGRLDSWAASGSPASSPAEGWEAESMQREWQDPNQAPRVLGAGEQVRKGQPLTVKQVELAT